MEISELRQGGALTSGCRGPRILSSFASVSSNFSLSLFILQAHHPLDLGKKSLRLKCMGVLCSQATSLEDLQGALSLLMR
eukprot:2998035-Amphidinium_carterae.2